MPEELKKRPDLLWGKHHGRIWRIVPENYTGKTPKPQLSAATTADLVKLLAHPDDWWRTTAQRLHPGTAGSDRDRAAAWDAGFAGAASPITGGLAARRSRRTARAGMT